MHILSVFLNKEWRNEAMWWGRHTEKHPTLPHVHHPPTEQYQNGGDEC